MKKKRKLTNQTLNVPTKVHVNYKTCPQCDGFGKVKGFIDLGPHTCSYCNGTGSILTDKTLKDLRQLNKLLDIINENKWRF